MRPDLAPRLRCPACRRAALELTTVDARDEREVRSGELTCAACGATAPIDGGIVDLLRNPPPFVAAEAAGLERFADLMRSDGWTRETVMELPNRADGYWYAQAVLMEQTLDTVAFTPGDTILDVGSNTCWAAATFAANGLDATALDIATTEMQGLATADWHFADKGVFFERVLSVDVRGPRYHETFRGGPILLSPQMRYDQLYRAATVMASRRSPWLRKLLLAGRAYVMGGTALHMVCTKAP